MKTFLSVALLVSAFTAQASVLECHLRKGKFEIQPEVVGTLEIKGAKATFVSKDQTINFDLIGATDSRTGRWLLFSSQISDEVVATLSTEANGSVRRTNISAETSEGAIVSSLSMKCME